MSNSKVNDLKEMLEQTFNTKVTEGNNFVKTIVKRIDKAGIQALGYSRLLV